jgi:hypothetical protein
VSNACLIVQRIPATPMLAHDSIANRSFVSAQTSIDFRFDDQQTYLLISRMQRIIPGSHRRKMPIPSA